VTITPTAGAAPAPGQAAEVPKNQSSVGQDAFIQLLITKLQNQDPTAPQGDTEFLAQLAQFSSLEQLQQMNQKLDAIADAFSELRARASGALLVDDSSTAPTVEGSR
jgi:flagellar basal-body rod modification protein FlgD